jgi:hypothetical protein
MLNGMHRIVGTSMEHRAATSFYDLLARAVIELKFDKLAR